MLGEEGEGASGVLVRESRGGRNGKGVQERAKEGVPGSFRVRAACPSHDCPTDGE